VNSKTLTNVLFCSYRDLLMTVLDSRERSVVSLSCELERYVQALFAQSIFARRFLINVHYNIATPSCDHRLWRLVSVKSAEVSVLARS